jgi:hypothetical protein
LQLGQFQPGRRPGRMRNALVRRAPRRERSPPSGGADTTSPKGRNP